MGTVWEGIRKAAASGAAKAQTAAENAVHRMEIQRKIAHHDDELKHTFTAIGRETYAAVRGGQPVPEGVHIDVAGLSALEAEIEELKTELAKYGGGRAEALAEDPAAPAGGS